MTYLDVPRIHFSGAFQAAPSTVNNDPAHFDNATFQPEYQERQTDGSANGWWNPRGSAVWRLLGCKVMSAWRADGTAVPEDDPVLGCVVADSDAAAAAKLVDLDPDQQLVSEVWGLEVRICRSDGRTIVRGRFTPTAFFDIWDRAASGGGDIGAGAAYQSVLTNVTWHEEQFSNALSDLRAAVGDGELSIKFNVDGYDMDFTSPHFTQGRIAGTIGPARNEEPDHFVSGRHFMSKASSDPQGFFKPAGQINFGVAVVDERLGKVHLDLGNALPSDTPGGATSDLGVLALVCDAVSADGSPAPIVIDEVDYRTPKWYERTAGVTTVPANRALTADELAAVSSSTLSLTLSNKPAIAEPTGGLYVRADQFVFRLNPGDRTTVRIVASRFGVPTAGLRIISFLDPLQLQVQGAPGGPVKGALEFPARLVTRARGVATLPITAHEPGNPRKYIDGMVYGIRVALEDTLSPGLSYPFNQCDFVSLLVWDRFSCDDPPTWHGGLVDVFTQYANLYPVMDRLLKLADYDSVCANRELLLLAFSEAPDDPNSMPVTRDMSGSKREAILRWLANPGADGKPFLGTPVPAHGRPAKPAGPRADRDSIDPAEGGKAAAAKRRLSVRANRTR